MENSVHHFGIRENFADRKIIILVLSKIKSLGAGMGLAETAVGKFSIGRIEI
jgi:hypothetical protein